MTWSQDRRDADAAWREMRAEAETVPCSRCGAQVGEHCRNVIRDGVLLAPAHPARIREADPARQQPEEDQ